MISSIISRLVILVFGTLYPAYASYKAVRTKNLKEYVKWMMYWIVFALFTCTETFTDVFLSWFPFYYEVKIVLVLWLLSPATKGSSILYRKFVHPALCRREQEIDEYIAKAKDQGYHTVLNLGTKGVNYATTVIMQTAIKGGGGLVQQLRKSYSLSDLTECEPREELATNEADDVLSEPRLIRRAVKSAYATRRSASESNSRQPLYFPEVDVDVRGPRPRMDEPDFSHIKSTEDISSGYSSAENSASLTRTASVGAAARSRARTTRTTVTTIKRPQAAEDNEVIIEELQEDDSFDNTMPPLLSISSPLYLSHTVPPFIYQYVGDQIKIIQVLGNPINITEKFDSIYSDLKERNDQNIKDTDKDIINVQKDDQSNIPLTSQTINSTNDKIPVSDEKPLQSNLDNECKEKHETDMSEEFLDTVSTSSENDNYSAESDDEASYGTPEPTPKSVKKAVKGKYGKSKAPSPPKVSDVAALPTSELDSTEPTQIAQDNEATIINDQVCDVPRQEILKDNLPVDVKPGRAKSKSPARLPIGSNMVLGKLLHFPSKLAFWNKGDEKSKSDISISSGNESRRSSEKAFDEFQSSLDVTNFSNDKCLEIPQINTPDDDSKISNKDAGKENITQDILEKSDELQKIIDAKLESHPEYKFVPLHDEIETASKSTDV
ncbi:uncharacterized protein LOC123696941 isoform X3 [Colias croceus]|uniref:uncharacterized protein LOC123696941 isoform X3 n=1 Tax=Colias crocea TaxID=72248 RepID=UPI001E27CDCB|nr:uncharacterized protein LOC123696941 isoform X3 [Colias croceus]